uniref:Uncharacterized protein n=1 Tax=Kalanchoe fedtschenkoi TaxID=63787 RepID=A0A7N0US46_KALFE
MGSCEQKNPEVGGEGTCSFGQRCKGLKMFLVWLCLVLSSVAGGIVLMCWELRYHPSYTQLWMVPCGLILFGTPMILWFSVVVSDILNPDHLSVDKELSSSSSVKILVSHGTRV